MDPNGTAQVNISFAVESVVPVVRCDTSEHVMVGTVEHMDDLRSLPSADDDDDEDDARESSQNPRTVVAYDTRIAMEIQNATPKS
jgi:hypothetical protein